MALFNCNSGFDEIEVTAQTNDLDTGELTVTDSLKIKGVQGVSVAVEGDTLVFGIDAETFPATIYTADSVEELPDPATVPEGSIGLVPSKDGGGGLPVVELTTLITYCGEDNPSTTTALSEAEGAALSEAVKIGLPVVVKWAFDSAFTFTSLGNVISGDLHLGFVYSNVIGSVVYNGANPGYEVRLKWIGNA